MFQVTSRDMMVLLEAFQKDSTSTFEFLWQFCIQDLKSLLFTVSWGYMYEQYRLVLRTQETYIFSTFWHLVATSQAPDG